MAQENERMNGMKDNVKSTNEIKNAKPGEIITFGTYPHMADGTDNTPIKWKVLENSGNELFILSDIY